MRDMVSTTSRRTSGSAGWASSTSTRASAMRPQVAAAGEAALVDAAAVGVHRRRCRRGSAKRSAAARRGASRWRPPRPATGRRHARGRCRARHRREDRRGIIVAGRAFGRRIAVAIARIVEREARAALCRNSRAAAATPICRSRRRGGRRSESPRRRRLRHSRSIVPLFVIDPGHARASWQGRRARASWRRWRE